VIVRQDSSYSPVKRLTKEECINSTDLGNNTNSIDEHYDHDNKNLYKELESNYNTMNLKDYSK